MKKIKILYVEDYPVVQDIYVEVLKSSGFEVELADDGKVALEKATNNEYDLMLVDLLLPQMTGIEFLESYRRTPKGKGSSGKIVVLTDFDSPDTIKKTEKLNVDGYWLKVDHTPYVLVEKIKDLFSPHEVK